MKKGIITFLIKNDEILLAESNYRPGKITWNGISGFVEGNEDPAEAAVRELYQKVKIRVYNHDLEQAGIMHLYTINGSGNREYNLKLTLFTCEKFQGEARITPGVRPRWFNFDTIPYDNMFDDTKDWLKKILAGEKVIVEVLSEINTTNGESIVKDVSVHNIFS